jgi:hypothetical protein
MREVNLFKFGSNDQLCKKLLSTGEMHLVYKDNDKYLANGDRSKNRVGAGENMVGEALMWVRCELDRRTKEGLPMLAVIQPEKIIPMALPQSFKGATLHSSAPNNNSSSGSKASQKAMKQLKKEKEREEKEKREREKREKKEKEKESKKERKEKERKEKEESKKGKEKKKEKDSKKDIKKSLKSSSTEAKKPEEPLASPRQAAQPAQPAQPAPETAEVEKPNVLAIIEPTGPRLQAPARSGGPPRRPPQRGTFSMRCCCCRWNAVTRVNAHGKGVHRI